MNGINDYLRVAFFILMGIGLALASVFLHYDKIDGSQWTTICLCLFGVDRLSNAVSEGVSAAKYKSPPAIYRGDADANRES